MLISILPIIVTSFSLPCNVKPSAATHRRGRVARVEVIISTEINDEVIVSTDINDEKVEKLFAWLSRAFAGEKRYNNLMLAFAAIFGDHEKNSPYTALVDGALAQLAPEALPVGAAISLRERERSSLGAMGAAQWTGQFRTRPHALLDVRGVASVGEWEKGLPRGARRTLARAAAQDFSVVARPIKCARAVPQRPAAALLDRPPPN